ncbi:MAG: AAA family ATPase [Acidimicrobiales bacterium]|nr:AAA family ATPase [Acidimicrobiales bacterium]
MTSFASDASASVRNRLVGIPDLDIPYDLVVDLVLRRSFLDDTTSVSRLSDALGLPVKVIDIVFEELRTKKYADVQGLVGNDYIFNLTAFGREQAAERFTRSKYASVAPVSLDSYTKVVTAQRPKPHVRREDVRHAFSDLVVYDELIDQIGPAFTAQESLFLYGPSGTGKTSIGERLIRLYHDGVLVPRAVEVDGQIITVFDPLVHHPLEPQPHGLDPRWVACYRPIVTVGGELELDMLQLSFNANTGIYTSPLQMRANNGILFIDDFGRQIASPRALLNRWIVPLDRRVDYLTLEYGQKFVIPFELMVVFSTNLDPADLQEDAFFRRIQNKIYVGPVSDEQFDWIVSRVAQRYDIPTSPGAAEHLRVTCRTKGSGQLLACYPNDFCRIAKAICHYADREVSLDEDIIDQAAQLYFATSGMSGGFFRRATDRKPEPETPGNGPGGEGANGPPPATPDGGGPTAGPTSEGDHGRRSGDRRAGLTGGPRPVPGAADPSGWGSGRLDHAL